MAARRLVTLLLLMFVARTTSAAGLGVAWDPSVEPGITGYRVYVGSSPGERAQFFDVGAFQTSFFHVAAVPGQPYYFSVATWASGVLGFPSPEVSGSLAIAVTGAVGGDGLGGWSALSSGAGSVASAVPVLAELAGGLGVVSSLATNNEGLGLFIEDGVRIRYLSERGIASEPAVLATEGERFLAVALDPRFSATRRVWVATETTRPGAAPQLSIVRHRLVAGSLGESATVVAPFPSSGPGALLALDPVGHIFVAQSGRVLRFAADGTIPRDQLSASPTWAQVAGRSEALLWDEDRQGLWVAGRGPGEDVIAWFVKEGGAASTVALASSGPEEIIQIGLARARDGVSAHVVTTTGATSTNLHSGFVSSVPLPSVSGSVVSWTPGPAFGAYVVVESAPRSSDARSGYRVLQVASRLESAQ